MFIFIIENGKESCYKAIKQHLCENPILKDAFGSKAIWFFNFFPILCIIKRSFCFCFFFSFALYDNHFKRSAFRETFELLGFILMVWYFLEQIMVFFGENWPKQKWATAVSQFASSFYHCKSVSCITTAGPARMCIRRRAQIILVRRLVNKALVVFLGFLSLWALLESCCSSAKLNQYKQQTPTHTDSEREKRQVSDTIQSRAA